MTLLATSKEYEDRIAVCKPCYNFQTMTVAKVEVMVCGSCGCVLQGKARIESAKCPLGKWEPLTDR